MHSTFKNNLEVTSYLHDWIDLGNEALVKLFPLVINDLKSLAKSQFRKERVNHTLQPTALVNECYLRLLDTNPILCQDREHFFALVTRIMRRILVEHARGRSREKRGGSAKQVDHELDQIAIPFNSESIDILTLDKALNSLAEISKQQAIIVELRFFAGLTFSEIGQVLNITDRTAKRKWAVAKIWLYEELCA